MFHINAFCVALPISDNSSNLKTTKVRVVDYESKRITPLPSTDHSPEPMSTSKSKQEKKADSVFLGEFKITAYCPCEECSEGYGNNTSTGITAKMGRTIAVDPDVISYGTTVYIEGIGEFVAEDCGGKVKGKHIDIYFESHRETVEFGVKYRRVERR